jgi:hypothetical protein
LAALRAAEKAEAQRQVRQQALEVDAEQRKRRALAENEKRARLAALQTAVDKARQTANERERALASQVNRLRLAGLRADMDRVRNIWRRNRATREAERRARQVAEEKRRRLAVLQAAVVSARQNALERERELQRRISRLRLADLRAAMGNVREVWRRNKRRRRAQALVAQQSLLAELGVRDPQEIERLAVASRNRLRSESILTDRLVSVLEEAEKKSWQFDRKHSKSTALSSEPSSSWAVEEQVRLKLEEVLAEIKKAEATAKPPQLLVGPTPARTTITLRLKRSNLEINGVLLAYDSKEYVVRLRDDRTVKLPTEHFDCTSPACPN